MLPGSDFECPASQPRQPKRRYRRLRLLPQVSHFLLAVAGAVEFARRSIEPEDRPSFAELEEITRRKGSEG